MGIFQKRNLVWIWFKFGVKIDMKKHFKLSVTSVLRKYQIYLGENFFDVLKKSHWLPDKGFSLLLPGELPILEHMAKVKQNGQKENKESNEIVRSNDEQKKNQVKKQSFYCIIACLSQNPIVYVMPSTSPRMGMFCVRDWL
jgi:hypothetical protein